MMHGDARCLMRGAIRRMMHGGKPSPTGECGWLCCLQQRQRVGCDPLFEPGRFDSGLSTPPHRPLTVQYKPVMFGDMWYRYRTRD